MKYEISVPSSDGESFYWVEINLKKETLTAKCNCTAGANAQMCKHKTAVLFGDESALDDKREITTLHKLQKHIKELPSLLKIKEFQLRIADLEKQKQKLDKDLKATKSELGRKLRDGI